MNEGQLLGNVFSLPQAPQYAQPARGAGVGGQGSPTMDDKYFGIPNAAEGLQWTGNVAENSRDYYDKLAGLRTLAQSLWLNYGIDVTRPDYSRPESITAAEAFKMELGNVLSMADKAKTSQSMLEKDLANKDKVINQGAFGQGEYYAGYTSDQQYTDVSLSPLAKEIANSYSGNRQTQGIINQEQAQIGEKLATMEQEAAYLDTTNPALAANKRKEIAQIKQMQNMYLSPPSDGAGYGLNTPAANLGELGNVLAGASSNYKPVNRVVNGYQVKRTDNSPFTGINIGGKEVAATETAGPDTWFEFTDGSKMDVNEDDLYSYLAAAYKKMGQEPQWEAFVKNGIKSGAIVQEDTQAGPVFKIKMDKIVTPSGSEYLKTREQKDPTLQKAIEEADKEIETSVTKNVDYLNKNWFQRLKLKTTGTAGANFPYIGTEDPPIIKYTSDRFPGYDIVMTPKGDKIAIKVVNPSDNKVLMTDSKGAPVTDKSKSAFVFEHSVDRKDTGKITELLKQYEAYDKLALDKKNTITPSSSNKFKAPNGYSYTRDELKSSGWTDEDIDNLPKE